MSNPHGSQFSGTKTRPVSLVPCDLGSGHPGLGPNPTADHFLCILFILNAWCSWAFEDYDFPTKNMKWEGKIRGRRIYFSPLKPGGPGYPGAPGGPAHPPFWKTTVAIRMMLINIWISWLKKQTEVFSVLCFCFVLFLCEAWIGRVATWSRKGIISRIKFMDSNIILTHTSKLSKLLSELQLVFVNAPSLPLNTYQ